MGNFSFSDCSNDLDIAADRNKDKCFGKKLCLSFLLAQKTVKTIQDHRKPDDKRPKAITPFVFPCPSAHESTKKDCNFPSFPRLLKFSVFCMIIECGACLGLKLPSTFRNCSLCSPPAFSHNPLDVYFPRQTCTHK